LQGGNASSSSFPSEVDQTPPHHPPPHPPPPTTTHPNPCSSFYVHYGHGFLYHELLKSSQETPDPTQLTDSCSSCSHDLDNLFFLDPPEGEIHFPRLHPLHSHRVYHEVFFTPSGVVRVKGGGFSSNQSSTCPFGRVQSGPFSHGSLISWTSVLFRTLFRRSVYCIASPAICFPSFHCHESPKDAGSPRLPCVPRPILLFEAGPVLRTHFKRGEPALSDDLFVVFPSPIFLFSSPCYPDLPRNLAPPFTEGLFTFALKVVVSVEVIFHP